MGWRRGFLIALFLFLLQLQLHSLVLCADKDSDSDKDSDTDSDSDKDSDSDSGSASSDIYDLDALAVWLQNHAMAVQAKQRTGTLAKVPLPSNLSGMEVSVVRLRTGNLWEKGANVSSFHLPPRVVPYPFVKRVVLLYENLGKLSSDYYHIPGYSFVAPVLGLTAYDASNLTGSSHEKVRFNIAEQPILVSFPDIEEHGKTKARCVKLGEDGGVQFKNMSGEHICITQGDGHFSVVVKTPEPEKPRDWRLWGTLIGVGFFGMVLVLMIGHATYKLLKHKKIMKMEAASENGKSIDAMWVGVGQKPSGSVLRTQPGLEAKDAP